MLQTILRWLRPTQLLALLMALAFVLPLNLTSHAQEADVVYGLFFYSPYCGHCHEVIDNHWPGIQAEFGDQLQVLFIDVSNESGGQVMQVARQAMSIASSGVPMLIIGDTVLVGSADIPNRTPDLVRNGLANGGIGYPPIPGIDQLFVMATMQAEARAQADSMTASETVAEPVIADDTAAETGISTVPVAQMQAETLTIWQKLQNDPANYIALIVLAGLMGSLLLAIDALRGADDTRKRRARPQTTWLTLRTANPPWLRWGRLMLIPGALVGLLLAATLFMGSAGDTLAWVLSAALVVIFLALLIYLVVRPSLHSGARWLIPALLVAGLLVAGYLAYIETTLSEATCGIVGDCMTVQQSDYATLFGVPVGVLGIIGYVALLAVWAWTQFNRQATPSAQTTAARLFLFMCLVGVGFSVYLTVVEIFVIGASCAWCLTSAVLMAALLWFAPWLLPERNQPVAAGD